jgi:hypothetical protein
VKLQPLLKMHATLRDSVAVGQGPYGNRMIADISGGTFEGERLRGEVLPSGADWVTFDADGVGHLDVRATLRTDDGVNLYLQYFGIVIFNDKANASLAGEKEAEFGDTYFVTQPRFETGDARYKWLNRIAVVAEGRVLHHAVEYQMFEVISS